MDVEKLKKLQAASANNRIGIGKGTPRRKTKKVHKSSGTDDKKLQTSLKKLNVQPIQAIEEVNMFKEDGNVIHFAAPKVHASVPSNTFAIYGNGEDKELTELVPGILNQLGPDSLASLRRLAESYQSLQKKEGGEAKKGDEDDDEIPDLLGNTDASVVVVENSEPQALPLPAETGRRRQSSPGLDQAFASAAHALHEPPSEPLYDRLDGYHLEEGLDGYDDNNTFCDGLDGYNNNHTFCEGLDPYSLPDTATTASNEDGSAGSTFSSFSPHLPPLLRLPGTDLTGEVPAPTSPDPYQTTTRNDDSNMDLDFDDDQDFDEEVLREPFPMDSMPSPTLENRSSSITILAEPKLSATSPEMLALRFDKQTCGILSIKDGPMENPWRNLIWPLAHESPALYHALNSMIAFHGSSDIPALRVEGMRQFTKSIKHLSQELDHMRTDAALATALALAISEGWDHHTTTGIQHLKGAKTMVNTAVVKHCQNEQLGDLMPHDAVRLKFLCNTYIYMDVIARLTSLGTAGDFDLAELVAAFNPAMPNMLVDVDPLLGCAVDLFPIIGRVASLIQTVRQTHTNSLQVVGEASELKDQLEHWEMPRLDMFDQPHDSTTRVQHAMLTAEAYRYAALLYLHQAVPEMASSPTSVLAKQVLLQLTNVPIWSRCVIIQIFPLLAAGCEVVEYEDRAWVLQRWHTMIHRLKIGNVNRCLDVIQEAWSRRDVYEADQQERQSRRYAARSLPDLPITLSIPHSQKVKVPNMDGLIDNPTANNEAGGRPPLRRRVTSESTHSTLDASVPRPPRVRTGTICDTAIDRIEPPYTVRGRLHWLGVMSDHGWEDPGMLIESD
ncbi:hypothetical protein DV738_g2233, partial [Chaetothyriales sp. CBS 135597]